MEVQTLTCVGQLRGCLCCGCCIAEARKLRNLWHKLLDPPLKHMQRGNLSVTC